MYHVIEITTRYKSWMALVKKFEVIEYTLEHMKGLFNIEKSCNVIYNHNKIQ